MHSSIEQQIEFISQELPFDPQTKKKIRNLAMSFARSYLSKLKDDEERFPIDIALSAIYISSNELGKPISQYEIAKKTGFDLVRWPCIVSDMNARVNNKSSKSY